MSKPPAKRRSPSLGRFCAIAARHFWETASFSVIVTDAEGRTVVSVTARASDAAPEGWTLQETGE